MYTVVLKGQTAESEKPKILSIFQLLDTHFNLEIKEMTNVIEKMRTGQDQSFDFLDEKTALRFARSLAISRAVCEVDNKEYSFREFEISELKEYETDLISNLMQIYQYENVALNKLEEDGRYSQKGIDFSSDKYWIIRIEGAPAGFIYFVKNELDIVGKDTYMLLILFLIIPVRSEENYEKLIYYILNNFNYDLGIPKEPSWKEQLILWRKIINNHFKDKYKESQAVLIEEPETTFIKFTCIQ